MYVTLGLLICGNLSLMAFFLFTLENEVARTVKDRLGTYALLVENRLGQVQNLLLSQSVALSQAAELQVAFSVPDHNSTRDFLIRYADKMRLHTGYVSLTLYSHTPPALVLARTVNVEEWGDDESADIGVVRTMRERTPMRDMFVTERGLALRGLSPMVMGGNLLGTVAASADVAEALEGLPRVDGIGVALLVPPRAVEGQESGVFVPWDVQGRVGKIDQRVLTSRVEPGSDIRRALDAYFMALPLRDAGSAIVGSVVVAFDATELKRDKWQNVLLLSGLFLAGSVLILAILYFNVERMELFFRRLKKIIIASHANDFSQRFESDHIHCLDVLHCNNEECPVYRDPELVCYLETGSEAISPRWRDTCIYLNKYDRCSNCPVYAMRRGDELVEARNVINTMMRLWCDFLSRVGHQLAYVLRAQEQYGRVMSLDDVSQRLEQMAKLTFFNHDLQGVLEKSEVYEQVSYVFQKDFGITKYVLFEVDPDTEMSLVAVDKMPSIPLCKREVVLAGDICRARRVAEDVVSFYNPKLCPYFNCDHTSEVRCCLPMVMGGQVGAVFSFLAPRREWDEKVRPLLPVVRKYLDECAPVLSSLRLLKVTKEQALRDPMTHCHNRRFLDEFITKYEPLSEREHRKTGFLMADLDFFKEVNDKYGHESGDAILKQVVAIMQGSVRRSDLVIRYGGEEFLMLLQDVKPGMSEQVAEKIRSGVEQHLFNLPDGRGIHKTISLGVAEYPDDAMALYKAIKFADVALYEAKNTGRNRVVRFHKDLWKDENY
ncbi:MAG: diguanylate cyclase [Desulfovibrionaceae bacterium]